MDGITHFVSVVLAQSHFAVLVYDLHEKSVIFYDGLNYPLKTWQHHIVHTLKKYGYQELDATLHVEQTVGREGDHVLELFLMTCMHLGLFKMTLSSSKMMVSTVAQSHASRFWSCMGLFPQIQLPELHRRSMAIVE